MDKNHRLSRSCLAHLIYIGNEQTNLKLIVTLFYPQSSIHCSHAGLMIWAKFFITYIKHITSVHIYNWRGKLSHVTSICKHYLGVAGFPLLPALAELPILSIHVPQFHSFPPKTKPRSQFTPISLLNPKSKLWWVSYNVLVWLFYIHIWYMFLKNYYGYMWKFCWWLRIL